MPVSAAVCLPVSTTVCLSQLLLFACLNYCLPASTTFRLETKNGSSVHLYNRVSLVGPKVEKGAKPQSRPAEDSAAGRLPPPISPSPVECEVTDKQDGSYAVQSWCVGRADLHPARPSPRPPSFISSRLSLLCIALIVIVYLFIFTPLISHHLPLLLCCRCIY